MSRLLELSPSYMIPGGYVGPVRAGVEIGGPQNFFLGVANRVWDKNCALLGGRGGVANGGILGPICALLTMPLRAA